MRKATVAALLLITIAPQAHAQPPHAQSAKPTSECAILDFDWRNIEMDLADLSAEEVGDDSAPRATLRAIKKQNGLQEAQITLQLMHDYKCTLPKRAPSEATYMLDAMKCATERVKGNLEAPECKRADWKPVQ